MMKLVLLITSCVALAASFLSGCANQSATAAGGNPSNRTYTSEDLSNTGRHDTAGAIQAADPSVNVRDGR